MKDKQRLGVILGLIAEGAPYRIEQIEDNNYLILVDDDDYAPDNGRDPYIGIEVSLRKERDETPTS